MADLDKEMASEGWTKDEVQPDHYNLAGVIGKNFPVSNACRLFVTKHWNGAGKENMNGTESWPVVELEVGFGELEQRLAKTFMVDLAAFVMEWMEDNNVH